MDLQKDGAKVRCYSREQQNIGTKVMHLNSKVSAIFKLSKVNFINVKNFLDLIQISFGPTEGWGKSKMLFQGAAKNRNKCHASKVSAIFKLLK